MGGRWCTEATARVRSTTSFFFSTVLQGQSGTSVPNARHLRRLCFLLSDHLHHPHHPHRPPVRAGWRADDLFLINGFLPDRLLGEETPGSDFHGRHFDRHRAHKHQSAVEIRPFVRSILYLVCEPQPNTQGPHSYLSYIRRQVQHGVSSMTSQPRARRMHEIVICSNAHPTLTEVSALLTKQHVLHILSMQDSSTSPWHPGEPA